MKHPVHKPDTAYANPENIVLPVIRRAKSVRVLNEQQPFKKFVSPYEHHSSTIKTDYLMSNWADKRIKNNKVHNSLDPWDKDRKGRHGQWCNVNMAFREDANKFLFIKGNLIFLNKSNILSKSK